MAATDGQRVAWRLPDDPLGAFCRAGLGGLPQVSLPLATFDGCPLGLSVVGWRGADLQPARLHRSGDGPYCLSESALRTCKRERMMRPHFSRLPLRRQTP